MTFLGRTSSGCWPPPIAPTTATAVPTPATRTAETPIAMTARLAGALPVARVSVDRMSVMLLPRSALGTLLAGLGQRALHLRVGAEVVQRSGDDRGHDR